MSRSYIAFEPQQKEQTMIQNPIVTIAQKYYTNIVKHRHPNLSEHQITLGINGNTLSTADYNKFLSNKLSRQCYERSNVEDINSEVAKDLSAYEILREHAPLAFEKVFENYKKRDFTKEVDYEFFSQEYSLRCQLFANLFPKELYGTKYRRCNVKVFEFINSIDLPDEQLAKIYLNDLADRADKSPNGIYSEMYHVSTKTGRGILRIVVNGYGTAFIDYIHEIEVSGESQFSFALPGGDRGRRLEEGWLKKTLNNETMIEKSKVFGFTHLLGFLVNLYLAEKTGSVVKGEETKEEKREVERLSSRGPREKKPKEVCYEYVKVTDDAWRQYEESERIRREGGPRGEYVHRKSFWWRNGHYRKQSYKNGESKIIFINGSYCHARTAVHELPTVEVLV